MDKNHMNQFLAKEVINKFMIIGYRLYEISIMCIL